MGCAVSKQYLFENPFESEHWIAKNKYRLFWKAADLNLTRTELSALLIGWRKISNSDYPQLGFDSLILSMERCPEIKCAFGNKFSRENLRTCPRFLNHARIFEDTIDMVINELSTSRQDEVCSKLVTFGSHHAFLTRKRFEQNFWCTYGQALLETAKKNPNTSGAFLRGWKKLVQCIIASMQIGYAIGYAQDDLPARFAFRKAVVDNELIFFPLSAENSRASQSAQGQDIGVKEIENKV